MACCKASDVIIQVSHQSQCYRIVQLHEDRSLHAFPAEGFGDKVAALDGDCARSDVSRRISHIFSITDGL